MSQSARARTASIAVGGTAPATQLAQIQSQIDSFGYCEIGYSASAAQVVGTLLLGSNQRLIVGRDASITWTSAQGAAPGIQNRTQAPANLAAYDVGPRVEGGGRLLGPWNGSDSGFQTQTAVSWVACRLPYVDAFIDGWQGDAVCHSAKSGDYTLYTYGAKAKVVCSNILRNGISMTEGEGFDFDVFALVDPATGRGCGLQVLDLEPNDAASVVRDGKFLARANGGGGGPLGGTSYIAAVSDKNGGTCRNITGKVIGRGGAYGGLYYRGVLGLTCEVDVEDVGGHGITGGNGAARASRVTLTADIGVKSGTAFNGWVDYSEGTISEVLAMRIREPNNVNPIAVRTGGGGVWHGLDITMTGAGSACVNMDNCTEYEIVAGRFSGGTYGVEFDDAHGISTHNKVRGGTFLNHTAGAVREIATCDYNEVFDISAEGSFPGVTLAGAHSKNVNRYGACTYANLPTAAVAGAGSRGFITDCNSSTFHATAAGGGANKVPVVSDGTIWLVG